MEFGVIKLLNRLDRGRFEPMICCFRAQAEATKQFLDPAIRVFELHATRGANAQLIRRLTDILRRERVDILHSHNWQTMLYAIVAGTLAGVPILVHGEHGRDEEVVSARRVLVRRLLATQVDRLVSVSEHLRREIVDYWRIRPERITVIANGVDTRIYRPQPVSGALREALRLAEGDGVVLNIGGIRPIKDHETLLRSFALVSARNPRARLLIVGTDFGRGEAAAMEERARELGIADVVRWPGARNDVPELLALCDIYVNSSRFEGMSNTILEAMATGKPVVATAVGGNTELVREGETGFLVPAANPEEMADRIQSLLADPDLRTRLGDGAKAHVERVHTMEAMVRGNQVVYEEAWTRRALRRSLPVRHRVKRWAARGIYWSGLFSIRRGLEPPCLRIATYHRVLPLEEALRYPFAGMVTPIDVFLPSIAAISRDYTVLPLSEAVHRLRENRLPARSISITFDDGYRDNFEHAWPVLQRFQVPATFFVVTGKIGTTERLWWDEVDRCIRALWARLPLDRDALSELPAFAQRMLQGGVQDRDPSRLSRRLVDWMNRQPPQTRSKIVAALNSAAPPNGSGSDPVMAQWADLEAMHRSGMEIEPHTVTHAFLDELSPEEVRREVEGSAAEIRTRLGAPASLFSFPRGRVREGFGTLLARAGIEAAVTTKRGRNRTDVDPYSLRRIDAQYLSIEAGFDREVLSAELEGWFGGVRMYEGPS